MTEGALRRWTASRTTLIGLASDRSTGVLLTVVSAASFGTMGVLARVAYDDGASPVAVLTLRFTIAAVCFLAVRAGRRRPRPSASSLAGLVVMGVGYLLQSLCYFSAIDHAPPGLVALLLYTFPVLVVAGGAAFLGERPTARVLVACLVAVSGTALIIGPTASGGDPAGILFALGAAVVYAAYILVGTRVLEDVDSVSASAVIMSTAGLGYVAIFLVSPQQANLPASISGWAAVIAIALVCTVVGAATFLAGLARIGPADASTISTIEPVVSVVLSALVTGEAITGWTLAGGTMVVLAVGAISRTVPAPAAGSTATH